MEAAADIIRVTVVYELETADIALATGAVETMLRNTLQGVGWGYSQITKLRRARVIKAERDVQPPTI